MQSIESPIERKDNFGALRIIAAIFVLIGHGFVLTKQTWSGPRLFGMSLSSFGLVIFFSVSGYLVTGSALNSNLLSYARKRIMRIYPAFFFVIVSWTFILGPIFSAKGASEYFKDMRTYTYLRNLIFFPIYFLPGNFENHPVPNAVNGSIWSLPIEVACYFSLVILVLLMKKFHLKVVFFGVLLSTIFLMYFYFITIENTAQNANSPIIIWGTNAVKGAYISVFFFIGSLLRLLPDFMVKVELIPVLIGALLVLNQNGRIYQTLIWILLPYIIISFGKARLSWLAYLQKFGDPSLGIYLWAFPIQQVIFQIYPAGNSFIFESLIVLVLSIFFGYLSWHLLEKHFLNRS